VEHDEIAQAIDDFTAKLMTPSSAIKAVEVELVEELPEVTTNEEKVCLTKTFRDMVDIFPDDWVGKGGPDIKDFVVTFLDSLPQCEEV